MKILKSSIQQTTLLVTSKKVLRIQQNHKGRKKSLNQLKMSMILQKTKNHKKLHYLLNLIPYLDFHLPQNQMVSVLSKQISNIIYSSFKTNFYSLNSALSKFLYSSVSGSLDFVDMNYETKLVLHDTYNMLMEQVEKDAPKVLEELKLKMNGTSQ